MDDLLLNQLYHRALDRELPFAVTIAREGTTFDVARKTVTAVEPEAPEVPVVPLESV